MTTTVASALYTPKYMCQSSSSSIRKPTLSTLSNSVNSSSNTPIFGLSAWIPQLGVIPFSQWNGLRNLGISISYHSAKLEKKRKCSGNGVFASLFGVGAPEALVIGVVALLVFGPKGLADVARNMGKTLRAFQPTIKELQDVSREFKSTLEREIGLDDVQSLTQKNYNSSMTKTNSGFSTIDNSDDSQMKVDPNGSHSTNEANSSEDYLKITEEQLNEAAATQRLKQTDSLGENQSEPQSRVQLVSDTVKEAGAVVPPAPEPQK